MRFVPIKTKEQQTALMLHRTRQLLVRQRTMLSNALRGHLAELGVVSAKGRNGTAELLRIIAGGADSRVSPAVRGILEVLARQYGAIGTEIASIDKSIMALHRGCEASRRLAEIPGGRFGEMIVAKKCTYPKRKRSQTLKRLPNNFKCADLICDFCGYLAQVKASTVRDHELIPASIL